MWRICDFLAEFAQFCAKPLFQRRLRRSQLPRTSFCHRSACFCVLSFFQPTTSRTSTMEATSWRTGERARGLFATKQIAASARQECWRCAQKKQPAAQQKWSQHSCGATQYRKPNKLPLTTPLIFRVAFFVRRWQLWLARVGSGCQFLLFTAAQFNPARQDLSQDCCFLILPCLARLAASALLFRFFVL